jgi:hypothetical protein
VPPPVPALDAPARLVVKPNLDSTAAIEALDEGE